MTHQINNKSMTSTLHSTLVPDNSSQSTIAIDWLILYNAVLLIGLVPLDY